MEIYQLGFLNDSSTGGAGGYFQIVAKTIEEKPLLDFRDAFCLAFQAIVILILGGLVQVSIDLVTYCNSVKVGRNEKAKI